MSEHVREIGMPRLSDSMEEATVTRWLKRPGDAVASGEELVEVETDKATIVYEAEVAGVLDEILVDERATAALGEVIARLRTRAGGAPPPPLAPRAEPAADGGRRCAGTGGSARTSGQRGPCARDAGRARGSQRTRRRARRASGTGTGGRIVRRDDIRAGRRAHGRRPATAPAAGAAERTSRCAHTATQRTIAEPDERVARHRSPSSRSRRRSRWRRRRRLRERS